MKDAGMIYIILLNWNNGSDTIACLKSLVGLSTPAFKVVIADNASSDESYDQIRTYITNSDLISRCGRFAELDASSGEFSEACDDGVVMLQTGANLGFAGGNNVAIRYALAQQDAEYMWLLNNDTEVDPRSLDELLKAFSSRSGVGICGSRLIYAHDRSKLQALGGRYNRWLATTNHYGAHTDSAAIYDDLETSRRIDYVVGASMLVSRKFILAVGLMSEDYFLYFEELDWAVRARRAGFSLHVASLSLVYHKEGGTINAGKRRRSEISERCYLNNRILITKKFFIGYLPTVWLFGLAIAFRRLLQRDKRGFKIAMRALIS